MTPIEKIEWAISQIEETTNFEVIAEMKAAMNSVYGSERNQIVKPTSQGIIDLWRSMGNEHVNTDKLSNLVGQQIMLFLAEHPTVFFYQAIIHFPEITITNGTTSHKITNIYVRFSIKPDGKIVPTIQGMRTTLTEIEYLSQYLHSHLHRLSASKIRFTNFCTGVGEINQVMALLSNVYSSANFMIFLMHIRNFLEWESKEGSPYILMENIFRRDTVLVAESNNLSTWLAENAANYLVDFMGKNIGVEEFMKMFTFTVSEKGIVVKETLKAERWMALEIGTWDARRIRKILGGSYSLNAVLCLRGVEGTYYAMPGGTMQNMTPYDGVILNFKGQDIRFQITEKLETKKNETYANPKITKEVCKKLSRLFTKEAITTPGIKSGSALVHNTRTSESDNLPVQQDLDRGVVGDAVLWD